MHFRNALTVFGLFTAIALTGCTTTSDSGNTETATAKI